MKEETMQAIRDRVKIETGGNHRVTVLILCSLLVAGTILLAGILIGANNKEAEILSVECQQVKKNFVECREKLDQCTEFSYKP